MNKELFLRILKNHENKLTPENYASIEMLINEGAFNTMSEIFEVVNTCLNTQININNNTNNNIPDSEAVKEDTKEDTKEATEQPQHPEQDTEGTEETDPDLDAWEQAEDIQEENKSLFNVLLSMDSNIMHNPDIDYTVYVVLKSKTEYDVLQKEGLNVDMDTVNLFVNSPEELGELVRLNKGKAKFASAKYIRNQLNKMQDHNILEIEKVKNKYKAVYINKVKKGEKGIMLSNQTIQNLSAVLTSDAMKIYMYLLSKKLYFNKTGKPFIVNASTISRDALGIEVKTESDLRRVYRVIKGLDTIHLLDRETKTTKDKNTGKITKIYKINKVVMPKDNVTE